MPCTAGSLLREAGLKLARADIDSASLDAQILLAHILKTTREYILIHNDLELSDDLVSQYEEIIARRADGEAVAYITGEKYFFNHKFIITPSVLVPRPETELLVEYALDFLRKNIRNGKLFGHKGLSYHDACTGSGCVGISIKAEIPELDVSVSDISREALVICKKNMIGILGYEIPHYVSDLLSAVSGVFACITANPPYVSTAYTDALMHKKLKEPRIALDGGFDGLLYYKKLIPQARDKLLTGGMLFVEIGEEQGSVISALYKDAGFNDIIVHKDLAGQDRIVSGVKA